MLVQFSALTLPWVSQKGTWFDMQIYLNEAKGSSLINYRCVDWLTAFHQAICWEQRVPPLFKAMHLTVKTQEIRFNSLPSASSLRSIFESFAFFLSQDPTGEPVMDLEATDPGSFVWTPHAKSQGEIPRPDSPAFAPSSCKCGTAKS